MSTTRNNITIIKESGALLVSEIYEDPTTDASSALRANRVTPFIYNSDSTAIPYSILVKGDIVEDYSLNSLYESKLYKPSSEQITWKNEFKVRTFVEGEPSDYANIKFDVDPNAPIIGGKPKVLSGIYLCVTNENGEIVQQFDYDDADRRIERILDSPWLKPDGTLQTNEETDETAITAISTGTYYGYLLKIEHTSSFDGLLGRVEGNDGREFSSRYEIPADSTHEYNLTKKDPAAQKITVIPFNITLTLEGEIDSYLFLDGVLEPLEGVEYDPTSNSTINIGSIPQATIDFVAYGESYED